MLQSLVHIQVCLLAFEKNCSLNDSAFAPTTSYELLTSSDWDIVMSLIEVLSPLIIPT